MRVMSQSPDPFARMHTMTKKQVKSGTIDVKAILGDDDEFLMALPILRFLQHNNGRTLTRAFKQCHCTSECMHAA
jgi:hypothetical protein